MQEIDPDAGSLYSDIPDIKVMEKKRPGIYIKDYLNQHGSASVAEIHQSYKEAIDLANLKADKGWRRPTYASFYVYCRHLMVLGMIEKVGEETTWGIENPERMGFIERDTRTKELRIHKGATKVLYRMTDKGMADDASWQDPIRARGYRVIGNRAGKGKYKPATKPATR